MAQRAAFARSWPRAQSSTPSPQRSAPCVENVSVEYAPDVLSGVVDARVATIPDELGSAPSYVTAQSWLCCTVGSSNARRIPAGGDPGGLGVVPASAAPGIRVLSV